MNKRNILYFLFLSLVFQSCLTTKSSIERTDLEIDNLNKSVKEISLLHDTIVLNKVIYNKKGFKTTSIFYHPNGSLRNEITFIYLNGYLVEQTSVFSDKSIYRTIFERDSFNRIILKTVIFPNNEIDTKTKSEYNENNQVIRQIITPKNGNSYCYTFQYGTNLKKEIHCTYGLSKEIKYNNDLIVEKLSYVSDGKVLQNSYKYKYNSKNDLIEEVVLYNGEERDRNSIIYEYDSNNNWISKTTTYVSGGESILKRQIKYY